MYIVVGLTFLVFNTSLVKSSVLIGSHFFSSILAITSNTVPGINHHSFSAYIHLPINTNSLFLINSL
ncbi:MAG: hypothetical protein Q8S84_01770 [bacterium]|nr:hypothetical protein [bacterium]